MIAFDEWYRNSGTAWSFPTKSRNEDKFRLGWRKALEWAKDQGPDVGAAIIFELENNYENRKKNHNN